MELAFPTYKITKNSSIDDLHILENLYSEIGGFASTILDKRHLAISKECVKRLRKVTAILNRRKESNAGKQEKYTDVKDGADLSALTVNELYRLYRLNQKLECDYSWKIRQKIVRRHKNNIIEFLSIISLRLLKSYRRFINTLFPNALDYDEQVVLDHSWYGRPSLRPLLSQRLVTLIWQIKRIWIIRLP